MKLGERHVKKDFGGIGVKNVENKYDQTSLYSYIVNTN